MSLPLSPTELQARLQARNVNHSFEGIGVRILSPVYVGRDKESQLAEGLEYLYRGGKVYILDFEKIFARDIDEVEAYEALAQGNGRFVRQHGEQEWVPGPWEALVFEHFGDNMSEVAQIYPVDEEVNQDLRTLARNGLGKPYLPGTALKGAIASSFLHTITGQRNAYVIQGIHDKWLRAAERQRRGSTNRSMDEAEAEIWKLVFGRVDPPSDPNEQWTSPPMRLLQVGDVYFDPADVNIGLTKIMSRSPNPDEPDLPSWKDRRRGSSVRFSPTGFTTTYEYLQPGTVGTLRINFARTLLENLRLYQAETQRNYLPKNHQEAAKLADLTHLFGMINQRTRAHLEREIDFFAMEETDHSGQVLDYLQEMLDRLDPSNQSCILRVGAGGGVHSVTGDWRYTSHVSAYHSLQGRPIQAIGGEGTHYKTRKLLFTLDEEGAPYFYPMGFVQFFQPHLWAQHEQHCHEEARQVRSQLAKRRAEAREEDYLVTGPLFRPSVIERDAPVAEAPVAEAPVVEAPVVEAPVVESPVVESPVVEAVRFIPETDPQTHPEAISLAALQADPRQVFRALVVAGDNGNNYRVRLAVSETEYDVPLSLGKSGKLYPPKIGDWIHVSNSQVNKEGIVKQVSFYYLNQ